MIRPLPVVRGDTVDARLREFRTVSADARPEIVSFDSLEGGRMIVEIIQLGLAEASASRPAKTDGRSRSHCVGASRGAATAGPRFVRHGLGCV